MVELCHAQQSLEKNLMVINKVPKLFPIPPLQEPKYMYMQVLGVSGCYFLTADTSSFGPTEATDNHSQAHWDWNVQPQY